MIDSEQQSSTPINVRIASCCAGVAHCCNDNWTVDVRNVTQRAPQLYKSQLAPRNSISLQSIQSI